MDTLFDKYHRSHSRGTAGERGTGLGLYICKQLVELHGGAITCASQEGRGTTFRFTAPSAGARVQPAAQ
jgi:signal transduction histidine kinase